MLYYTGELKTDVNEAICIKIIGLSGKKIIYFTGFQLFNKTFKSLFCWVTKQYILFLKSSERIQMRLKWKQQIPVFAPVWLYCSYVSKLHCCARRHLQFNRMWYTALPTSISSHTAPQLTVQVSVSDSVW